MPVCMSVHVVPEEAREGHPIPLDLSYRHPEVAGS